MSEWSWVVAGYTVVYGAVVAYAVGLSRRLRAARRHTDGDVG